MKVQNLMEQTEAMEMESKAKMLMVREQKRLLRKLKRKQKRVDNLRQGRTRRRRQRKQHDRAVVDCMVTPWTTWSACSATCGKGTTSRSRMIKVQAEDGGRKCPRRLVKTKPCMTDSDCRE